MALMKDGLGKPAIVRIATGLQHVFPLFDSEAFVEEAERAVVDLALKERVDRLIVLMHHYLSQPFEDVAVGLMALPEHWDFGDSEDPLRGFAAWPVIDYVARYGFEQPELSLSVLKVLTHLFSAEFAIRPFILQYPALCHGFFLQWIKDDSEHVRRLVSEGTRPRLPWGKKLQPYIDDPQDNLVLLSTLCTDSSLYVRRSVANHLNDIAKDHPEWVIDVCLVWQRNHHPLSEWVIKHGTRTLVKQGHPAVFQLLGYSQTVNLSHASLTLKMPRIALGDTLEFECELLTSLQTEQKYVIDYQIDFVKANGKTRAKVFKLKNITLPASVALTVTKTFSFKAITTRRYYPGVHRLSILVNGMNVASKPFMLSQTQQEQDVR